MTNLAIILFGALGVGTAPQLLLLVVSDYFSIKDRTGVMSELTLSFLMIAFSVLSVFGETPLYGDCSLLVGTIFAYLGWIVSERWYKQNIKNEPLSAASSLGVKALGAIGWWIESFQRGNKKGRPSSEFLIGDQAKKLVIRRRGVLVVLLGLSIFVGCSAADIWLPLCGKKLYAVVNASWFGFLLGRFFNLVKQELMYTFCPSRR